MLEWGLTSWRRQRRPCLSGGAGLSWKWSWADTGSWGRSSSLYTATQEPSLRPPRSPTQRHSLRISPRNGLAPTRSPPARCLTPHLVPARRLSPNATPSLGLKPRMGGSAVDPQIKAPWRQQPLRQMKSSGNEDGPRQRPGKAEMGAMETQPGGKTLRAVSQLRDKPCGGCAFKSSGNKGPAREGSYFNNRNSWKAGRGATQEMTTNIPQMEGLNYVPKIPMLRF